MNGVAGSLGAFLDKQAQKKFNDAVELVQKALPESVKEPYSSVKFPPLKNTNVDDVEHAAQQLGEFLKDLITKRDDVKASESRKSKAMRTVIEMFRTSYPFAQGLLFILKDAESVALYLVSSKLLTYR